MSIDRFAAAEAALKAGDTDEGIRLIAAELESDPKAPVHIYRNFASMLFRRDDYVQAEKWAGAGAALYPKDYDLWNVMGVAQRRQKKFDSAIKSLKQAEKLNPKNTSALQNRGNIYNDVKNGPASVEVFTKLVRLQPKSAEFQRCLGRGYWYSGALDKAVMRLNLAIKLQADYLDAWLDLTAVTAEMKGYSETHAILDQASAVLPPSMRLHEAKAMALRRSGRLRDAEAYLIELMPQYGDKGWLHYQLGGIIGDYDRRRGNVHLEKAIELVPDNIDYRMALIESLARSRYDDESAHLERAYTLLKEVLSPDQKLGAAPLKVALETVIRVADYDAADSLGSFSEVGHTWIDAGKHTALLGHLARVQTPEDRLDLVEMHRKWGRKAVKGAERWPVRRPPPRTPNGKIRLGFMSSDLRGHPVAYFSLPLFEHIDRSRFEIYCYSYFEGDHADSTQQRITELVDAFRWKKDISSQDAAQMIADDQLDMLIELGGSTHMNKLSVMAFKPAPLQASWLGYPHSAGPETIDHFILDPHLQPPSADLVIEEPLLMPKTWLVLSERAFPERPITEIIPETRNGFVTFGTANNPYKYSREMLQVWARIVAQVPNSKFLFVRPEGGAPSFRKNIIALFAAEGVSEDRIIFEDIRGAHIPFYNEMDLSLDTFPQTGGTTTCEALWMGVPVVTLIGDAVFERMSYSVLNNAGLGDLCAKDEQEYIDIAVKLANDPVRRQRLRTELRGAMKASPLGQQEQFAKDFYDMVGGAVTRAQASGKVAASA